MNIYYLIWSDAIASIRKYYPYKRSWKIEIFVFITSMHAFNLWIVLLWLKYFNVLTLPPFNIDIFPGNLLDSFVTFVIVFASPFVVLNYFLIFYNNRYEKILTKYKHIKVRYGAVYFVIITLGAFVSAILYGILT